MQSVADEGRKLAASCGAALALGPGSKPCSSLSCSFFDSCLRPSCLGWRRIYQQILVVVPLRLSTRFRGLVNGCCAGDLNQLTKYKATRSVVQVATPVPKKSASSVHTGQPIVMAQGRAGQLSASRMAIR